jgi:methionine-rich copper-binding protein CopC
MRKLIRLVALSFLSIAAAQAHTQLSSSMPADDAVLEAAPEQVVLHFSEPVRLTALSVEGPGTEKQDLGPLPSAASAEFTVAAPSLPEGRYDVSWRALSADTHVVSGQFTFTVRAGGAHGQHSGH